MNEVNITLTQSEARRVLALRAAVKLEALGMKRGGRSATAIARDMIAGWGLHAPRARADVLAILDQVADTLRRMLDAPAT